MPCFAFLRRPAYSLLSTHLSILKTPGFNLILLGSSSLININCVLSRLACHSTSDARLLTSHNHQGYNISINARRLLKSHAMALLTIRITILNSSGSSMYRPHNWTTQHKRPQYSIQDTLHSSTHSPFPHRDSIPKKDHHQPSSMVHNQHQS